MRKNLPVLDQEVKVSDTHMIVSRTNLKGVIDYVNQDFLEVSGFTESELLGAPHNIVRHPDMPEQAFADLWRTLKAGRPWTGLVKNRCKNGAYYWVLARATPVFENGQVVAYLSVRTRPTQAQIDSAAAAYRAIREGTARGKCVAQGAVVSSYLPARAFRALGDASLASRHLLHSVLPALLVLAAALTHGLGGFEALAGRLLSAAGVVALLQLLTAPWIVRSLSRPLRDAVALVQKISAGNYSSAVPVNRNDDIGRLQAALSTMQTRLGFEIAEARRVADENARVRSGLDASSANVLLADAQGIIRYVSPAASRMFVAAQADLRQELPAFDASRLLGADFDSFHRQAAHQRAMLAQLSTPHRTQIRIGGRTFALNASPIRTAEGQRLGTVVEWQDRTAEIATEFEVNTIVTAAAAGDFSARLRLEGKQGFFRQLSEGINRVLEVSAAGLSEVGSSLAAIAEGDLTRQLESSLQGTFGQLQQDCNLTVARLQEIVTRIRQGTDTIANAAQEVATGNADLARRTEHQASALEETAAALEQLTSTVRTNAENADRASQLAAGASRSAQGGGSIVQQVVQTMVAITESSRKITDIIGVIDGIAFQTNILALNAAVEAARAGEEGRGFAVVAGEVRTLAVRSAEAARQIKALIGESVSNVETGARLVDATGQSMKEIVSAIGSVTGIVGAIASASKEQAIGIEQINLAVTQMDDVAQQNAALVEQASAAATMMTQQSQELSRSAAVFRLR